MIMHFTVCLGAYANDQDLANADGGRQFLLRGSPSFDERQLFDSQAPFDFYEMLAS